MIGFLLGEAVRDLRRAGRAAVSAVVLVTLSLVALGAFGLLSTNVGRAVAHWRDRVRIVVYLRTEPAPSEVSPLLGRVRSIPDVADVRFVGKAEALSSLRTVLGKDAHVVDQLPSNPLSASLEVTPSQGAAAPQAAQALLDRLAALPEADEVAGGIDWVDRLARWQRLLVVVGLGLGSILAAAAILVVTTATTLVLHARRHETEIMRLVGASEVAIRLPLLLQGLFQGLIGALAAILILSVGYRIAVPRLEPLVTLTLGLPRLTFLPAAGLAGLLGAGALLGALGGWLVRGRRGP